MASNMYKNNSVSAYWFAGVILVLLVVWEGAVRIFAIPAYLLPPVEAVWGSFADMPAFYLANLGFTLATTVIGFIGAAVFGLAIAIGIVASPTLERILYPIITLVHSVPKVALAPLLVVSLGTGVGGKVALVILMSFFTITIDTVVGMRSIDPEIPELARIKHAPRWQIMFKLRFPQAMPNIFGAFKAATSFALIGAVVSEFVGGDQGLGYVILVAEGNFDAPRAFVAIFILAIIGVSLFYLVSLCEAWAIPWHVSHRGRAFRAPVRAASNIAGYKRPARG